jgi:D-sedoheptulose 7-phosphate isomerase
VSVCISQAVLHAYSIDALVFGIVGKDSGTTAQYGDHVIVIPELDSKLVTPLSEAFQAVVWHALVSDPRLQTRPTKW